MQSFPVINGPNLLIGRSDQMDLGRTLSVNAFDILGLFGRRGGFLRPILQNTIGNGNNPMTLQAGLTLLNSLIGGFTETGGGGAGTNKEQTSLLGLNFV